MPRLILAAVTPANTPGGYDFTFLFPMLLFIVVALVLYMLFSRPHRRVPGRSIIATAAGPKAGAAAGGASGSGAAHADAPASDGTASDGKASENTGASE